MRTSSRQRAWALSDPRLSNTAKMRKKCCYGQKNFGSICSSLSASPTHLSHPTNINPFENKVWEIYFFYKEVCSFVHWSLSLSVDCFRMYYVYVLCSCMWLYNTGHYWGCPRGVMVKAMNCGIVISEFELQSRYYVHFRANTLGKGMNPLILPAMG